MENILIGIYTLLSLLFGYSYYGFVVDAIKKRKEELMDTRWEKYLKIPVSVIMGILWPLTVIAAIYNISIKK